MALLKLYHNNPTVKTITDFVNYYKIGFNKKYTLNQFWADNRSVIFEQLSAAERIKLSSDNANQPPTPLMLKSDMTLPCPCIMYVPEEVVTYNLLIKHTNFQIPENSVIAFQDENIRSILTDPEYTYSNQNVLRMQAGVRVVGWFKSQWYGGKGGTDNVGNIYDSEQMFTDLTPYVINLSTTVSESGGNFNMTLPHLPMYSNLVSAISETFNPAAYKSQGNANLYIKNAMKGNGEEKGFESKDGQEFAMKSELGSMDYLTWLIQPNDLLFIAFNDVKEIDDKRAEANSVAGKQWDMIALVNSVSLNKTSWGEYSVTVNGRDLMQLITDDSSIYFPNGVTNVGETGVFHNAKSNFIHGDYGSAVFKNGKINKEPDRTIDGLISLFAEEPNADYSIDFVLKAIVYELKNYLVTPDEVYNDWGDRRTSVSQIKPVRQTSNIKD